MYVLGEQTGMKLSCIKPTSKVRGISKEPRSSTGCIDACIIVSVDSIIESVDSISRDERDVPLTQYITNA